MEKTEPTFVPQWLKSTGGLSTTSLSSSSALHSVDNGGLKSVRNKSLGNDLGRGSGLERTTSSYLRRPSISNGSASSRSYSSFGRNHRDRDRDRDRDWDKDVYEFRNKDKQVNRHRDRDYSDPLGNILPSRFEKDGLRRSNSSLSGKRSDSWPRKVASDLGITNKSSHSNGGSVSSVKSSFERDFPSLGADEKHVDSDIGRIPSPGLSSAIQSLPMGNSGLIGGDGWTSALAEVPVIVGNNGNSTSSPQPVQPASISATTSITGGRNMAETLAHGPPRTQAAPQLAVETQRLEELAVKQSRQLIPMTPSMPKALALNSSDKPKLKGGPSQLQSSHLVNQQHTPRSTSVKPDVAKTSTMGKLLVLKPSRERNGISPTPKESLSPTGGSKLPVSSLSVPSAVGSAPPLRNTGNSSGVANLEKRPSSQALSRSNFFNLMRKKSLTSNSSVSPDTGSSGSPSENLGELVAPPAPKGELGPAVIQQSSETKVELICNGGETCDAPVRSTSNGNNHSGPDVILYSEEEEARFLRSLGWDETAEEEEGLTEEEISSFYKNYMNIKPDSKILKGTQLKLLMPIGEISSNSKMDA